MLVTTQDNFPKDALEPKNFLPIEKGEEDQVVAFKDGYLVFIVYQGVDHPLFSQVRVRVVVHEENLQMHIAPSTFFPFYTVQINRCSLISNNILDYSKTMWITQATAIDLTIYCENKNVIKKEEPEVLPIREAQTLIMDLEIPEEL